MTGISSWARFWARYGADRVALVHEDGDRTWGQLEEHCSRLAADFLATGLRKGDRVGGLLRNGPDYLEVILGCARIGAVFVPLNPLLTGSELRLLAADAGLSALVTDASFTSVLGPLDELIGAERIFFAGDPPALGRSLRELHQHGAVRDDRAIITVPLAFTGASVSVAVPFLRCGGSLVIRHEFVPARVLDDIERGGVTFIGVVPLILERMAAEPGFAQRDLTELLLAGSTVMKEYWRNPQATAETLRDGWLHTGDVATVDDEGYFRIVDRAKDMIISGGINIYPAEIVLRDAPLPRGMSGKILKRALRSELQDSGLGLPRSY